MSTQNARPGDMISCGLPRQVHNHAHDSAYIHRQRLAAEAFQALSFARRAFSHRNRNRPAVSSSPSSQDSSTQCQTPIEPSSVDVAPFSCRESSTTVAIPSSMVSAATLTSGGGRDATGPCAALGYPSNVFMHPQ